MSNQKDEAPNSPIQSSGLPFKKRGSAETMSSNNSSRNFFSCYNDKKITLGSLQKQAYYDVLHAFIAETPSISSSRILLIKDLMKEWNIHHTIHSVFQDKVLADKQIQKLWGAEKAKQKAIAAAKEQKITGAQGNPLKLRMKVKEEDILKFQDAPNVAPAKIQEGKVIAPAKIQEGNVIASDDSPVPSWGQVSPESLVDRWIKIRLPGEENYNEFLIKQYNAESEMHHLVTALSRKNFNDPCDWIGLRHIPGEDIEWKEENPGFPIRKSFLKQGETLLRTTSTARQKKQLKEVGKTASGIPIIKILDKGKGIFKILDKGKGLVK